MAYLGRFVSAQTDGLWTRGITVTDWLGSQTGGMWLSEAATFPISGSVCALVNVTGSIEFDILYFNSGVVAKSSISATTLFPHIYTVSGLAVGLGSTYADIVTGSPIIISGYCVGRSHVTYKFNNSKSSAFNPILIRQNRSYNDGDCPIAAIEYEGFSPNKIINIISREGSVFENSDSFYVTESLEKSGGLFPINYYPHNSLSNGLVDYLVTDLKSNIENEPLYFQYELLFDSFSEDSNDVIIQIYKNDETTISKSKVQVQYSYDLLGNSYSRYGSTSWSNSKSTIQDTHRVRLLLPIEFYDRKSFFSVEYTKVVNDVKSPQKELIELKPIYNSNDFNVTSAGLVLASGSLIPANVNSLYLIKDPRSKIVPLGIAVNKDNVGSQSYVSDQISSWNLRLSPGSFVTSSGYYSGTESKFYRILETNPNPIPVVNLKPELISETVVRVDGTPVFVNEDIGNYTYPTYNVPIYDKIEGALTDYFGKFVIETNGISRSDLKIVSVDRDKGYIQFNKPLSNLEEIDLSYYIQQSGVVVLSNLELNPKINVPPNTSGYHLSGFLEGATIAVRPYDPYDPLTIYPYIYNSNINSSERMCYPITPPGSSGVAVSWSSDFVDICSLGLNKLSTNMIKLTDARKIGGGVKNDRGLDTWFQDKINPGSSQHEKDWYSDWGNYDGEPLAHSSLILIHVPESNLSGIRQNWVDYYKEELDDYDVAYKKGNEEFNFWLDQTIRRYISSGSDYILISTVSGDFDSSTIKRIVY